MSCIRKLVGFTAVLMIVSQSGAAIAQQGDQAAKLEIYNGHVSDAKRYFDAALEAEQAGKYHDACDYYTTARDEYRAAIFATVGLNARYDNEAAQGYIDSAMERSRAVCGKEDEAVSVSGSSFSSSSEYASSESADAPVDSGPDSDATAQFMALVKVGNAHYFQAVAKENERDYPASCASNILADEAFKIAVAFGHDHRIEPGLMKSVDLLYANNHESVIFCQPGG